jgi:exodeoxyribonuclease V gamma subunit
MRDRGRSVELARTMAAKKWDDDRFPGECSDPEHVLLHGEQAPLSVLTDQLPGRRRRAVRRAGPLRPLARRLWQPLLDHETTGVP